MDVPDRSIGCHQHPVRACPRQDPSCLSPTTAGTGSSLRLQWQTPIERAVGTQGPTDPRFPAVSLWISMSSFSREPPAGGSGSRDPFHSRPLTPPIRCPPKNRAHPTAGMVPWPGLPSATFSVAWVSAKDPHGGVVEWVSASGPQSNGCLQNLAKSSARSNGCLQNCSRFRMRPYTWDERVAAGFPRESAQASGLCATLP